MNDNDYGAKDEGDERCPLASSRMCSTMAMLKIENDKVEWDGGKLNERETMQQ